MERRRQLDASRRPAVRSLTCLPVSIPLFIFLFFCVASAQTAAPDLHHVEELFHQERWQEIVALSPAAGDSADLCFYYGSALTHLGRLGEAKEALQFGFRAHPTDPRFPVELAGVAFKQQKYPEAQSWLEQALRLSPGDAYSNDFLATIFFLQGNLDAAVKYWNKILKPRIESVSAEPSPRLDPVLLDHAFAFSPASTLKLADLKTSEARIAQLGVFTTSYFDLQARDDGSFDLVFRNLERSGCGGNRWACLLNIVGSTPAQTVRFDYFDIHQQAINLQSLYRWDSEKRRLVGEIEMPVSANPKWHFGLDADLRNENWGIRSSFSGPAPLLGAFNLKRQAAGVEFSDVMGARWSWSTQAEFSHRAYHNVLTGVLTPEMLAGGAQLKQSFTLCANLLRWPERRLTIDSDTTAAVFRLWSGNGRNFSRIGGGFRLHWFPQHGGDNYEVQHTLRAGQTFGDPPFDELFVLGVLGDTDLLMRAHIATRDGKKGSAPLGRNYFLSNWEATRNISPIALVKLKVGPFVDTGKMTDPLSGLGSHQWLWDVGAQVKVQVFSFRVTLSYGRDLRSGRNAVAAQTQ